MQTTNQIAETFRAARRPIVMITGVRIDPGSACGPSRKHRIFVWKARLPELRFTFLLFRDQQAFGCVQARDDIRPLARFSSSHVSPRALRVVEHGSRFDAE